MKPGVYPNISNDEYHSGPGISNSGLALLRKSPLHLRMKQLAANDNKPREQSVAMMIGTAFHELLLEPEVFTREYCLGLRQSDFPESIDSRDQLVTLCEAINAERELALVDAVAGTDQLKAMIAKLNETRLPKLPTSGSKDDLIARILELPGQSTPEFEAEIKAMKAADLKAFIDGLNALRPGLLTTSGTEADLCATLRGAGAEFFTRKEALAEWQAAQGSPMLLDTKGSMQELAEALRINGKPVTLWKDLQAEWMTNNGHRNVLTPEQWDQLHNMRAAVFAHPMASRLMQMQGKAEQSVYWIDKETGELCRCRPDWWPGNFIVDLKTTDDASPTGFAKSIANFAYDVQDAFYTDGVAAVGKAIRAFLFLAVQKDACVVDGQSFGVAVYQLDDASRELGRAKYRADLRTFAQCKADNKWPNYGDTIQPITLPAWNFNQFQHLVEASA